MNQSGRSRSLAHTWPRWAAVVMLAVAVSCGGPGGPPREAPAPTGPGQSAPPPLADNPKAKYWAVQAGRYVGLHEVQKAAEALRAHGLETFYYPGTGRRAKSAPGQPPEQSLEYELAVGLFGLKEAALNLAGRLRAQGLVSGGEPKPFQVTGAMAAPLLSAQNSRLYGRAQAVLNQAAKDAARPTAKDAATGQAFKNVVYGQYIGSYRDRSRAEAEAQSLTRAGWPASVESSVIDGELWTRVYLAPAKDQREWRADPNTLKRAKEAYANRRGLLIIADVSGMPESGRTAWPGEDRRDASSCAGYSQFGLYLTVLKRLSVHVPSRTYQAALREISRKPKSLTSQVVQAARELSWAASDDTRMLYSLSVYDHQAFMAALGRLDPQPEPAPLAAALNWVADDLAGVSGPKTVVIFSNFHPGGVEGLAGAAARLEGLKVVTVYGDPGAEGYRWAGQLAQGGGEAWEACRLMADSAYYERFVSSLGGR